MCSKWLKGVERLSIIIKIKAEVNEEIGVQERSGEWQPPGFIAVRLLNYSCHCWRGVSLC